MEKLKINLIEFKKVLDIIRYNEYFMFIMSQLMEEIKQTKPFSSIEEEVFLNMQRTAYTLRQSSDEVLKKENLTGIQYNVLRILRGAAPKGLACSQISERLVTKDSDITRLLERLEKRGLVKRERGEEDRRVIVSIITEKGLNVLANLDKPIQEKNKSLLGHLGEDMLQQLNALLVLARNGK